MRRVLAAMLVAVLVGGCVPIGARVQNMYAQDRGR